MFAKLEWLKSLHNHHLNINGKRKTLDLNESPVGRGCEIKKNQKKKVRQKRYHNELLEKQKQQLKLLEESEKGFQAFQSEMSEK